MLQQLILTNPTNAQGIKVTRENAAGLAHNLLDMRNLVRSVHLENGVAGLSRTAPQFSIRITAIRPGKEPMEFYEVYVREGDYLVLKTGGEIKLLSMGWKEFKDKYDFESKQ